MFVKQITSKQIQLIIFRIRKLDLILYFHKIHINLKTFERERDKREKNPNNNNYVFNFYTISNHSIKQKEGEKITLKKSLSQFNSRFD